MKTFTRKCDTCGHEIRFPELRRQDGRLFSDERVVVVHRDGQPHSVRVG